MCAFDTPAVLLILLFPRAAPPQQTPPLTFLVAVFSPLGSWVELEELIAAVSRRESLTGPEDSISSTLQGELERILLEAQLECERSRER